MKRTANTGKYMSRFCVPVRVQERNVRREQLVGYVVTVVAFAGLIAVYIYAL